MTKMATLQQLKQKCSQIFEKHENGNPSYSINHYKGTDEMGEYEYWEFYELDNKGKKLSGFSSPDYDFFESHLEFTIKSQKEYIQSILEIKLAKLKLK